MPQSWKEALHTPHRHRQLFCRKASLCFSAFLILSLLQQRRKCIFIGVQIIYKQYSYDLGVNSHLLNCTLHHGQREKSGRPWSKWRGLQQQTAPPTCRSACRSATHAFAKDPTSQQPRDRHTTTVVVVVPCTNNHRGRPQYCEPASSRHFNRAVLRLENAAVDMCSRIMIDINDSHLESMIG